MEPTARSAAIRRRLPAASWISRCSSSFHVIWLAIASRERPVAASERSQISRSRAIASGSIRREASAAARGSSSARTS